MGTSAGGQLYPRPYGHDRTARQRPLLGQACDDIRPGYRKPPIGSHMLFYVIRNEAIVVLRVLHQQMDVEDKL
jgi:plasmid stabilization system protein ParE